MNKKKKGGKGVKGERDIEEIFQMLFKKENMKATDKKLVEEK